MASICPIMTAGLLSNTRLDRLIDKVTGMDLTIACKEQECALWKERQRDFHDNYADRGGYCGLSSKE